jgi:hypothetical protein
MSYTIIRGIHYPCARCGGGAERHDRRRQTWWCDDGEPFDSRAPYQPPALPQTAER